MKNRIKIIVFFMVFSLHYSLLLPAQTVDTETDKIENIFAGYHIGIVQPLYSIQKGVISHLFGYNDYSAGLAIGLSLNTPGRAIVDLEFVSFISQLPDEGVDLKVHLLYHPGILLPLGNGFTLGARVAFETGQGKWGFTPLLNKSFDVGACNLFLEIVAPGRFGPGEDFNYSQVLGVHAGVAF
ncbi:MAG: hypothetical protein IPL46_06420 [Saprospiraceae bacterium]|nr:hypothetical protein [Saprospiraceae bacterium]